MPLRLHLTTPVALVLLAAAPQQAGAEFVESTLSGHYDDTGSFLGGAAPTTENYSVGFIIDPSLPFTSPDKLFVRRNYFVFDLSTITAPVGSAELVLPVGGFLGGVEAFDFIVASSVFSGAEVADPTLLAPAMMDAMTVFASLGVESFPGQEPVGEAMVVKDDLTGVMDAELVIPLDLDFFNSMIGGELVLGGRIVSDSGPEDIFAPPGPGLEDERILFAFTNPNEDFVDSVLGVTPRPRIAFTVVPEPSAWVLAAVACGAATRRNARSSRSASSPARG